MNFKRRTILTAGIVAMPILAFAQQNDRGSSPMFEVLNADRIYYIRTDGDDGNDGLVNTPGGAFKTIQGGYDKVLRSVFTAGFKIIFKVGPGTFDGLKTSRSILGAGEAEDVLFEGDSISATLVNQPSGGSAAFHIGGNAGNCRIYVKKMKISAPTGYGILVFGGACAVHFGEIDFGPCGANHMTAAHNAWLYQIEPCIISGGAMSYCAGNTNAVIALHGSGVTFTAPSHFPNGFISANGGARVYPWPLSVVNGSYATGLKFSIGYGSTIVCNGDVNALPGTHNSWANSGGYYL